MLFLARPFGSLVNSSLHRLLAYSPEGNRIETIPDLGSITNLSFVLPDEAVNLISLVYYTLVFALFVVFVRSKKHTE